MLKTDDFYNRLTERGITFFAGVPDSLLKDICAYITDNTSARRNVTTSNEGSAIGLAAGHHLATGEVALVYMQNSGLGNAVNPLTSLADEDVYGIPMLLMIGWRGEPGKKDEPQHVKMGKVQLPMLDALGIAYSVLPDSDDDARIALDRALEDATENCRPHAIVVRKGTFEKYTLRNTVPVPYLMTREEAIAGFVAGTRSTDLIVSTTGKPSRELFETREARGEPHDCDFLTVGSMGHSSQIALGVALQRPERQVYCLDGDGALIMHMGGLATIASLAPPNFRHVILNNGAHDSVGGQPTVGFHIDICRIASACGYKSVFKAETEQELEGTLHAFRQAEGPALIEIRVTTGARADLGRPTMTPKDLKRCFMAACVGNED